MKTWKRSESNGRVTIGVRNLGAIVTVAASNAHIVAAAIECLPEVPPRSHSRLLERLATAKQAAADAILKAAREGE